jgi:undecaprenyl-diphosphatase
MIGLLAEHTLRTVFAKPVYASVFLALNGLILLAGEWYRRRAGQRADTYVARSAAGQGAATGDVPAGDLDIASGRDEIAAEIPRRSNERGRAVSTLRPVEAVGVGVVQSAALLAGISRSGVTMVAGLVRGLTHEDAARFAFLLATPIILLAGVYKLPDLFGSNGNGVRGQILAGSLTAGVAAYLSVRFLDRWFQTRTLTPFAIYCLLAGGISLLYFA